MQKRYLHQDTVMRQTVDERIIHPVLHLFPVIVERLVVHVYHSLVNISHSMAQQIHSHHRHGISLVLSLLYHILLSIILGSQITSEPERLGIEPCLLKFDKDEPYASILFPHPGSKVDAKHRDIVSGDVRMLMPSHFHAHHFLFQQGGEHGFGDAFVFHQEFEHRIVYRISYIVNHISVPP